MAYVFLMLAFSFATVGSVECSAAILCNPAPEMRAKKRGRPTTSRLDAVSQRAEKWKKKTYYYKKILSRNFVRDVLPRLPEDVQERCKETMQYNSNPFDWWGNLWNGELSLFRDIDIYNLIILHPGVLPCLGRVCCRNNIGSVKEIIAQIRVFHEGITERNIPVFKIDEAKLKSVNPTDIQTIQTTIDDANKKCPEIWSFLFKQMSVQKPLLGKRRKRGAWLDQMPGQVLPPAKKGEMDTSPEQMPGQGPAGIVQDPADMGLNADTMEIDAYVLPKASAEPTSTLGVLPISTEDQGEDQLPPPQSKADALNSGNAEFLRPILGAGTESSMHILSCYGAEFGGANDLGTLSFFSDWGIGSSCPEAELEGTSDLRDFGGCSMTAAAVTATELPESTQSHEKDSVLQEQLTTQLAYNEELQKVCDTLREERDKLQSSYIAPQEESDKQQEEYMILLTENAKLRETIAEVQGESKKHLEDCAVLQKERLELQKIRDSLEKENAELRKTYEALQRENTKQRQDSDAQHEELQKKLTLLQEENLRRQKEYEGLQAENAALRQSVDRQQKESDRWYRMYREQTQQNFTLRQECDEQRKVLDSDEKSRAESAREQAALKLKYETLEKETSSKQAEIARLKQQLGDAAVGMAEQSQKIADLMRRLEQSESETADLKKQRAQFQAKITDLTQQWGATRATLEAAMSEIQSLKQQLAETKYQRDCLKKSPFSALIKQLQDENADLRKRIASLKAQIGWPRPPFLGH